CGGDRWTAYRRARLVRPHARPRRSAVGGRACRSDRRGGGLLRAAARHLHRFVAAYRSALQRARGPGRARRHCARCQRDGRGRGLAGARPCRRVGCAVAGSVDLPGGPNRGRGARCGDRLAYRTRRLRSASGLLRGRLAAAAASSCPADPRHWRINATMPDWSRQDRLGVDMTEVRRRGRGEQADRSAGGECSRPGSVVDTARRRKLLRLGVLVLIGALVAGAVALVRQAAAPAWPPRDWSMAVCDVGQGDALLLHTGPASAIAVDTGPEPDREDACLRRFGITDLPLVVLTHFHEDHIGGLTGLLAGRKVAAIETTLIDNPAAGARRVREEAAAAGVPVRRVQPFERGTLGRVTWHALWPDPDELPAVVPTGNGGSEEPIGGHG